jgi:hypothetical protein
MRFREVNAAQGEFIMLAGLGRTLTPSFSSFTATIVLSSPSWWFVHAPSIFPDSLIRFFRAWLHIHVMQEG